MSHAVTITRTTTTTTGTSALIINTGYLKTVPGLLKLAQLVSFVIKLELGSDTEWPRPDVLLEQIIGGLCVFFVGWNFWSITRGVSNTELFFLCMAVTFFIGTFCLLASCLVSLSTGGIISRTIYELVYHSIAFLLYLIASILLLIKSSDYRREASHPHMMASVRILMSHIFLFTYIDFLFIFIDSRSRLGCFIFNQCSFCTTFIPWIVKRSTCVHCSSWHAFRASCGCTAHLIWNFDSYRNHLNLKFILLKKLTSQIFY